MMKAEAGDAPQRPLVPPWAALFAAVLAMSWAGPLVRYTDAPPLAIAAWRLTISVAIIAVILAIRRPTMPRLSAREWALAVASGLLLAAHFWSWITSLELTTVASSVVLVSTQPLFVAVLSAALLHERPGGREWTGILIATAGAMVIGFGDWGRGGAQLLGDALALAGAVFAAGYYVIGRRLRARLELWLYIGIVYGIAAVALLVATGVHPDAALGGHGKGDWLVFVALAVGPMMIGHTGVNYALRYVPAFIANLVVLGEPVGATLIAWVLPRIQEVPPMQTLLGGALILAGIVLGTATGRRRRAVADETVGSS